MVINFDYKSALSEVIRPLYREHVPGAALDLYNYIRRNYGHLRQNQSLGLDWPPELKPQFERLATDDLALSSRLIYYMGHWGGFANDSGAYWRYAIFADQTLRDRLGIPYMDETPDGWSLSIHEGVVRVRYGDSDMWIWEEICPALETCGRGERTADLLRNNPCPDGLDPEIHLRGYVAQYRPTTGIWGRLLNLAEYAQPAEVLS